MPTCPHCQGLVTVDAVKCPHCGTVLKAYGHPGMPLHQAGEGYLCASCAYHADDSCTYPQRPYAKTCMLYHNLAWPSEELDPQACQPLGWAGCRAWGRRHRGWLLLGGILLLSLGVALLR